MLSHFQGKIEKRPDYQVVYQTARRDSVGSYNSYHSGNADDNNSLDKNSDGKNSVSKNSLDDRKSSKDILDEVDEYQKKNNKQQDSSKDLDAVDDSEDSDQDLGQKLKEYNFHMDEDDD